MEIIAIAGQLQNGKDTIADRLAEKLEGNWKRKAFASNVKKVFTDTFGGDLAFIEQWKTNPEPPPGFDMNVRQSLQFIGDGFRKILPSIWIDLTFRNETDNIIISDVRYINEASRVQSEGGINILVGRPDKLNSDPNGSEAQMRPYVDWCLSMTKHLDRKVHHIYDLIKDAHAMPEHLKVFDYFVRNDSTKDDLHKAIDTLLLPMLQTRKAKHELY